MIGQTITIISGVVLLVVFALVGWTLRRKRIKLAGIHPPGTSKAPEVAEDPQTDTKATR